MKGVFDNKNNREYNDIKPNLDPEDGIDIVKCEYDCPCKDVELNRCLYETCIYKIKYNNVKHHKKFTHVCSICREKTTHIYDDIGPRGFIDMTICKNCINKLREWLLK